jgi:hypothetical protein
MTPILFKADFNNVAEDGRLVKVSMRHAADQSRAPSPGDRVFLYDDEANTCQGTADRVEGQIVFVELDEATWLAGEWVRAGAATNTGNVPAWQRAEPRSAEAAGEVISDARELELVR